MPEPQPARSTATWSRIARRIRVPLGFAFAAFYLWRAKPSWPSLAIGTAIALLGIFVRAMASGHVEKNRVLTATGPYAYVRNPLYLGSIIIGVGFGLAARDVWIFVAILLLFVAIYLPVIRGEERFLQEKFPEFEDYSRRVPRMLPRLTAAGSDNAAGGFSIELYMKHREWNALLGSVLLIGALIIKMVLVSR